MRKIGQKKTVRKNSPSMKKSGMGHKKRNSRVMLHGPNLRYKKSSLTNIKRS